MEFETIIRGSYLKSRKIDRSKNNRHIIAVYGSILKQKCACGPSFIAVASNTESRSWSAKVRLTKPPF